jgi:hypothetical protein
LTEVSTRDISKLVKFYNEQIRPHSQAEQLGIFRTIQRLLAKGLTMAQMSRALQNYAADDYVKASDPRLRMNIRSFFSEAIIKLWQEPVRRKALDSSLAVLDQLEAQGVPPKPPRQTLFRFDDESEDREL